MQMKIDRLYTLSQFVDFVYNEIDKPFRYKLILIKLYNNFLKKNIPENYNDYLLEQYFTRDYIDNKLNVNTWHGLAEATNGQLKLKNIEI